MDDADRFHLLGKYKTPRFRIGQRVRCEVRGQMVIKDLTDAPIPWPLGYRKGGGGGRYSLIIFKGLTKAIRRESNLAVAHWWGIDVQTVSKWRRLLSVGKCTEGTTRLFRENISETGDTMRALSTLQARNPERRRKISEGLRGKPKPPHVIEAVRQAHLGKPPKEETRRKMSETRRQRGILVPGTIPWMAEEDELVRTLPATEAARRTGRSLVAVYSRRNRLWVPDGRRHE